MYCKYLQLVHIVEKKISLLIRRDSKMSISNVFLNEKKEKKILKPSHTFPSVWT